MPPRPGRGNAAQPRRRSLSLSTPTTIFLALWTGAPITVAMPSTDIMVSIASELIEGCHPNADAKNWIQANPDYMIPDIVPYDGGNRRLSVICIGAGMSGICMAYKVQ